LTLDPTQPDPPKTKNFVTQTDSTHGWTRPMSNSATLLDIPTASAHRLSLQMSAIRQIRCPSHIWFSWLRHCQSAVIPWTISFHLRTDWRHQDKFANSSLSVSWSTPRLTCRQLRDLFTKSINFGRVGPTRASSNHMGIDDVTRPRAVNPPRAGRDNQSASIYLCVRSELIRN